MPIMALRGESFRRQLPVVSFIYSDKTPKSLTLTKKKVIVREK